MPESRQCKKITARIYNKRLIEFIEAIPKGLRSAVIEVALAMYRDSVEALNAGSMADAAILGLIRRPNSDDAAPLARLKGDF